MGSPERSRKVARRWPFYAGTLLVAACQPSTARVEPVGPPAEPAPAQTLPAQVVTSVTFTPALVDRDRVPLLSPDTVPVLPELWSRPAHGRPLLVAHPDGPSVLVFEQGQEAVVLLDATTGSVRWRRPAPHEDSWTSVTAAGSDGIMVHGFRGARQLLLRLAVKDGAVLHRDDLPTGYRARPGGFGTGLDADDNEHCTMRARAGTGIFVGPVLKGIKWRVRGLDGGPDGNHCSYKASVHAEVLGVTVMSLDRDDRHVLSGFSASGTRWSLPAGGIWKGLSSHGDEAIFLRQGSFGPAGDVAFVRIDLATGKIRWEHAEPRLDPCPDPRPLLVAPAVSAERVPGPAGHPEALLVVRCGTALLLDTDTGERVWEQKVEGTPFVVGQDPPDSTQSRIAGANQDTLDWLLPDGSRVPRVAPPQRANDTVVGADGLLLVEGDVHTMVEPSGRQRWQYRAEIDDATWRDGAFVLQTWRGPALIDSATGLGRFAALAKRREGPQVIGRAGPRSDVWILWREYGSQEAFAVRFSR